jgi:hypothetical protein
MVCLVGGTRWASQSATPRAWVSEEALNNVRKVAPGWDRQFLLTRYMEWTANKDPA